MRSPTIALDATICEKFTEFGDCVIAPVMCNSHKHDQGPESTKTELLSESVDMSQTKEEGQNSTHSNINSNYEQLP